MSRHDTVHDGLWNRSLVPQTTPAETKASRSPTKGGNNKVYFRYNLTPAHCVTVECDLSPGFKIDGQHKLIAGHVRLRCPLPDCPGWLHIWANNKTVFCHPTGLGSKHLFDESDGFDGSYLLPILTVLEPVACNYRERTNGAKSGCRWKATIAEGTAYDYGRAPKGYKATSSGLLIKV